jgi:chromosome partitioning protein
MNILVVYSNKGGVGKTSTAVNLAHLSAQQGLRTLVWDLDAQGASSFYFRIKPKIKGGSKALVTGKSALEDLIKGTDFENLDLLPADFSLRHLDLELDAHKKPRQRVQKILQPLQDEYDVIFLDCPPGFSLLSEAILHAADALIIPVIPTPLSTRAFEQLDKFIVEHALSKPKLLPFFSMVDRRKKVHQENIRTFSDQHHGVLQTAIPYASDIERMGVERMPLTGFVRKSVSTQAYAALWQEICSIINLKPSNHN